jgi:hypothetical protein
MLLAGALGCMVTAGAEGKPSVMLKVSSEMHTDRTKQETGGGYGSRGRPSESAARSRIWRGKSTVTSTSSMEISIEVWNTDAEEQDYEVLWYYIANPTEPGEPNYVFEQSGEHLALKPRERRTITHESGSLTITETSDSKSTTLSGGKLVGFIVAVFHGDDMVASDASSWDLKRIMQNPKTRKDFLVSQTL